MKIQIVSWLGVLSFSSSMGFAGWEPAYRSPADLQCENRVEKNEIQIDPLYAVPILDQKKSPTCFGYASHYLLQYLHNRSSQRVDQVLSVPDVIARGLRNHFPEGGDAAEILQRIRQRHDRKLYLQAHAQTHPESLYRLQRNIQCFELTQPGQMAACLVQLEQAWPSSPQDRKPVWQKRERLARRAYENDPETVVPSVFREEFSSTEVQLPAYNVYRYWGPRVFFGASSAEEGTMAPAKRIEEVKQKVRALFQEAPNPIVLGFAPGRENGMPQGQHAVVIRAVRTVCCGPKEETSCHEEWQIENSNYEAYGWQIPDRMIEDMEHMVYLRPCGTTSLPGSSQEQCVPTIQSECPLIDAIYAGDLEGLKLLVPSEVKRDRVQAPACHSPLNLAAFRLDQEALGILLEAGISPNQKDKRGTPALHSASHKDGGKIIDYLLEQGADPNLRDGQSLTFFEQAAQAGNHRLLQKVLSDPELRHKMIMRNVALNLALKSGDIRSVQILLDSGFKINEPDLSGYTPIFYAAGISDPVSQERMIQFIVNKGAKINTSRTQDRCDLPIHFAAKKNKAQMVRTLLQLGAEFETFSPELGCQQWTLPVVLALESNSWDAFQVLAEAHAQSDPGIFFEPVLDGKSILELTEKKDPKFRRLINQFL